VYKVNRATLITSACLIIVWFVRSCIYVSCCLEYLIWKHP